MVVVVVVVVVVVEEEEEEVGKEEFTCKSKEINGKGHGKIVNKEMIKKS